MKHLKSYEVNELYWFEILLIKKSVKKIKIAKDIIDVLEERNCEYRLYYHKANEDGSNVDSVVILTSEPVEDFELPRTKNGISKGFKKITNKLPKDIEKYRIDIDDLEVIFNANNFNL